MSMQSLDWKKIWKETVPTKAILLLMTIGFVDLITTAVLHSQHKIVELNPIMRPLIESSEWLFAGVKALSLILAWVMMARYAKSNLNFVRKAALVGAGTYLLIWTVWFIGGSIRF